MLTKISKHVEMLPRYIVSKWSLARWDWTAADASRDPARIAAPDDKDLLNPKMDKIKNK